MIKITFPDGNVKEFAKGTTAYQIAESISPRLAADSLAASVNGATVDLDRAHRRGRFDQILQVGRPRRQARLLAHLVAPAGRGARSALPGHQVRHRPGASRTDSTTTWTHPCPSPKPTCRNHREEDDRAVRATRSNSSAREVSQGRRAEEFHRKGRSLQSGADPRPGRRHDLVLHQRRIHRPLPGTAPAQHGVDQGHQAHLGRRSLLARQREEQDAHPHLRHLLPQEVDARRVSGDDGGGQETRPPQAGQGAGAFLLLATRRPGAAPVAAQGRCPARPPGTVPARRAEGVRLPAGHHAPHRQ